MKISFSRKGFDSTTGKAPSPIIDGVPRSLPIPEEGSKQSMTTYDDLGLGDIVEALTKRKRKEDKITGRDRCHYDPMFENGRCAFGQSRGAQTELKNNNFSVGDVFLFFGLFSTPEGKDKHHRIFGYLRVEKIKPLGLSPSASDQPDGFTIRHPHTIGKQNKGNCLYTGPGLTASHASDLLRLSCNKKKFSQWKVPAWLCHTGLTRHKIDRWENDVTLNTHGKWQEGITDISGNDEAKEWLDKIIKEIHRDATP